MSIEDANVEEEIEMKLAFWILLGVGLVGCSAWGIGPSLRRAGGDWGSPWMLAGIALGLAIMALAGAFVAGFRPALLPSDTAMVVALGVLIAAKVGVSLAQVAVAALARG